MKNTTEHFIERAAGGEKAILVQVYFYQQPHEGILEEFLELVRADELETLAVIASKRTKPEAKYFVGEGKAQEIADSVKELEAEVIIFNHELSAAQGRNLERLSGVRVIDRTELILDIFAKRARTFEGKLQVELAQLRHLSTCLVRGWTHLERQKGGIGLRGPGETQLETDRRLLDVRIKHIQKQLEKIINQRMQSRRARKRAELPLISLVGYTNAGKSTLFNQLTTESVYTADQLFATLDPTLRQIKLPHIGKLILTDTVGFIRDLPHDLIAAFRATLEETCQADLLLHVIDASQANVQQYRDNVDMVLHEIHADEVPQLLVYNKIDKQEGLVPCIDYGDEGMPKRVWISAMQGSGLDLLKEAIIKLLGKRLVNCSITLSHAQGRLRAKLYDLGVVREEQINAAGEWEMQLTIQYADYQRLLQN